MCLLTRWCLLAPLGTPPVAGTKTTEEGWGQSPKVAGVLGTEPKESWWQNVPGEEMTRVKASEEKTLTRHGPEMNRFRVGIRTERSARWGWTGVLDGSWQKKVNTVFKSVTWEWWQDSQEVEKVTGLTGSWMARASVGRLPIASLCWNSHEKQWTCMLSSGSRRTQETVVWKNT